MQGKIMSIELKTPWYKYYDGVREHLEYPTYSIYSMLKESVNKYGKSNSYNYFGKTVSYEEFDAQIEETAKAFKANGINPGDIVSICMPNTPEALMAFYAINKIGAVSSMIHPLSAENEIKHYVNLTKSKVIVTIDLAFNKINHIINDTGLEKVILVSVKDSMPLGLGLAYSLTKGRKVNVEKSDKTIKWHEFIESGKKYTGETFHEGKPEDTAAILYSGGTSGFPKGIELTNYNFNSLAISGTEACHILKPGDKVLAIMPVFHGFGLGICIHTTQYFGGCSVILPQFNAATFDQLLTKYRPNVIAGVPSLYEAMLRNKKLDGVDLSFLKCVISGGDSLSVSLKQKIDTFLHEHGAMIQVREGYGLTECVTGCCMTPEKYYREGSIGIPYPDIYFKIIDPSTMEELPYGEDGEIVINGPTVMKGYYNDPEESEHILKTHEDGKVWLHTGDLGYMDEEGFVYFKQRIKRMIVSSGYNLYPQYIENIIDQVPEVLMSCVIGIDHQYKVQVAKAFIVLREGIEDTPEIRSKIRSHCEQNLVQYSWPYAYEFRKELPKTLVGKVAFNVLMEEEKIKNGNTKN